MGERKAFIGVDADIDERLERLAQDKGVATMVTPEEAGQGADAGVRKTKPKVDPESIPTPRSQMRNVNIEIPDYVWRELKVRAAHRGTTLRHVIMTSLKEVGFDIRNADMIEDGRSDRTIE